ncbi:MAG TPA: hypothetical protein VIM11_06535 [Tepidisphaeraceae bacterium]
MLAKWASGLVLTLLLSVPVAGLALAQVERNASQQDREKLLQMIARNQQRRMQTIKQSLGCTDEEFKILEPKVERVILIQFDQAAGYSQFGRRGIRGGAGAPLNTLLPQSEVMKARLALQEAVDDKALPVNTVVQRLKELRAAREATHAELVRAQSDLRDFLTVRQEAVLVTMGLLE